MDPEIERQHKIISRLLAKANPPKILHRYRRPNEWALREISNHEVHVTSPKDMNDPFEYNAPLFVDLQKLKSKAYQYFLNAGMKSCEAQQEVDALDARTTEILLKEIESLKSNSGIICCTSNPRSNRMWAYYADSHRGICIGYLTDFSPFNNAMSVIYEDPSQPLDVLDAVNEDVTQFCDHLARRKVKEWEFEEEYRIPVREIPKNKNRILPVSKNCIKEIRLGVKIDHAFKSKVIKAVKKFNAAPKIIQMGCDYERFIMTETEIQI